MEDGFIAISKPSQGEGVGQALQAAFRDSFDLPADMRGYLDQLDRIAI